MSPLKIFVSSSVCIFTTCLSLKAQHFNTNESIASQVINNRQPGLLYAPVTKSAAAVNAAAKSSHANIVNGLPVAATTGAAATSQITTRPIPAKRAALPSDVAPELNLRLYKK